MTQTPDPLEYRELLEMVRDFANLHYLDGVIVGNEAVAAKLIQKSGEAFAVFDDKKAEYLRHCGMEIRADAKEMRATQQPRRDKDKEKKYEEIIGWLRQRGR